MRPITVTVGPLAAGQANCVTVGADNVGPGAGQLALGNVAPPGGSYTYAFDGTCTINAGILTVNSTILGQIAPGMRMNTNSVKPGTRIIGPGPTPGTWRVTPTQTLGGIEYNGNPVVTFDQPRQVLFTTTEAAPNTFTIIGTDGAGNPISETLLCNGGNLTTSQNFKTITEVDAALPTAGVVTAGTGPTATTPWVMFDPYASGGNISKQTVVSGVANYTVQVSYDDPNAPGGVAPGAMGWLNDTDATFVGATTSLSGSWPYTPLWARVLLNSGAGSVRATFIQPGNIGR